MSVWPERFEMTSVNDSSFKGKIMLIIRLGEDIRVVFTCYING